MVTVTVIGAAYVDVEAKTDGFGPQAEKGILGAVGGIASKAAGIFAAGFAIKQGADFFGGLIKDASESRRVLAETEQAIKATGGAAGVSAKEVSALADSLSKKTGIDDEQIQTGENLLLCIEESAQALTRDRGWVDHRRLSVGDDILVYDPADDSSRWEPILDFYRYEVDTELVHWKSKQIDVMTTPHHRWWVTGTSGYSEFTPRFMTTEQVSGHQYRVKIGGGRPGGFRSDAVLSDDIVELLGWVVTEGNFKRWVEQPSRARLDQRLCSLCHERPARNTRGIARCEECAPKPIQSGRTRPLPKVTAETSKVSGIVFSQSQTANPKHVARIRELVDRLVRQGHPITEAQYIARYNDSVMSTWSFVGPLAREVRRLLPDKKLTPDLLSMLTQDQAELLLDTMLDGDGHRDSHGHRQYIQKDHGQLDVVAMLCAMLGIRTSVLGRGGDRDAVYLCATNHLKGHAVHAQRVRYSGVVWCPQVRTGIFMARNRGRTFWTGNTFKSIRNEAGAGNDIFNQSTKAVLDLSKQFGGVEASAVQVGKALNDPVAGVTALTRVGIQFTDKQKDTIKALVETGDVLGAQKIILGEIAGQVGGQAEAQATAADKLKVVWGNLREELGAKLLPVVDKVATFLAERLPGALDFVSRAVGPVLRTIGDAIKGLIDLVVKGDFTGAFRRAFGVEEDAPIIGVILRIRDAAIGLFNLFVKGDFTGAFRRAFNVEEDSPLVAKLLAIRDAVIEVVGWVRDNLQPILIGLAATFLLLTSPLTAVAAALIYAYTQFDGVRTVVDAVVSFLTGTVLPAIAAFAGFIVEQFGNLVGWVQTHWASIQEAIGHVIAVVQVIISGFVDFVTVLWHTWGDEILNVARIVWDEIMNVVQTAVGIIQGVIEFVLAVINGDWGAAWDAIKSILATAWDFIKETLGNALRLMREAIEGAMSGVVAFLGGVPGKIVGAIGDLGSTLYNAGLALMRGLKDGIVAGFEAVKHFVGGIAGKIADLKGPLDYDRKLLIPAGDAIMEGLEKSLRRRQASVEARVRAITAGIANAGQSGVTTVSGVGSGAVSNSALAAEIRQLSAAVSALAAGGGSSFNVSSSDPLAAAAAAMRMLDWNAGR